MLIKHFHFYDKFGLLDMGNTNCKVFPYQFIVHLPNYECQCGLDKLMNSVNSVLSHANSKRPMQCLSLIHIKLNVIKVFLRERKLHVNHTNSNVLNY